MTADPHVAMAARAACAADPSLRIALVVPRDVVADPTLLGGDATLGPGLSLLPATSAAGPSADASAVRAQRLASVRVAAKEVRDGRAEIWTATGPAGPAVAASQFTLGLIPGVSAPVIAVPLSTPTGPLLLVAGGEADDPSVALIGATVARTMLGVSEPRVRRLAAGWPTAPAFSAAVLVSGSDEADVVITNLDTAVALLQLLSVTGEAPPALLLGLTGLAVIQPAVIQPAVIQPAFIQPAVIQPAATGAARQHEGQLALAVRATRTQVLRAVTEALAQLVLRRREAAGLESPRPGAALRAESQV